MTSHKKYWLIFVPGCGVRSGRLSSSAVPLNKVFVKYLAGFDRLRGPIMIDVTSAVPLNKGQGKWIKYSIF